MFAKLDSSKCTGQNFDTLGFSGSKNLIDDAMKQASLYKCTHRHGTVIPVTVA